MSVKQQRLQRIYPFLVTFIFLSISIFIIYLHVFTRDEQRAWYIVSAWSTSFKEFLAKMRDSEGTPYLWNTILYFVTHYITDNIEFMKVIHLSISTVTVFLFLKYAPFNKIVKTLFVFGYFPFYEYSIISRNYAIGIIFMVIFLVLYKDKYKNIITISIVLFMMGQGNMFSFIISVVLFLMLAMEFIIDRKIISCINKKHFIFATIIFLSEVIFVFIQLGPQLLSNRFGPSIFTIFNKSLNEYKDIFLNILPKVVIPAYLPIPRLTLNFWGSNLIIYYLSRFAFNWGLLIALILLVIPIFLIKRKVIFLYVTGTIGILIFPLFIYRGRPFIEGHLDLRQYGHIFIFFIICLWISCVNKNDSYLIKDKSKFIKKFLNIFLMIILIVALFGSLVAIYFYIEYSFSPAKYVTEYIEKNYGVGDTAVVLKNFSDAQTISSHLDMVVYCMQCENFVYFPPYKLYKYPPSIRVFEVSDEDLFKTATSFNHKNVLVVTSGDEEVDQNLLKKYLFKEIDIKSDNLTVDNKGFNLYEFDIFEQFYNKSLIYPDIYSDFSLKNVTLSDDKELVFKNEESLSVCEIPVLIKSNTNYLVIFEIKETEDLDDSINFDFYGDGYDNPEQEFNLNISNVNQNYKQFYCVLNTGEVPSDAEIYFRIFTYSGGEAIIRKLYLFEERQIIATD